MCRRGTFTHARPSFYHSPPLRIPPTASASLPPQPLSAPLPPPPAVSVAAVSIAAVSAAATIAVSAHIAAAFWSIVVCPRCCLCFRLPPPSAVLACPHRCHRSCLPAPLPMSPPPPPPPLFLPPSSLPPLPIFLPPSTLPLCFNVSDCLYVSTFLPPRPPLPLFLSPSPP
jgi:hypothetical protein